MHQLLVLFFTSSYWSRKAATFVVRAFLMSFLLPPGKYVPVSLPVLLILACSLHYSPFLLNEPFSFQSVLRYSKPLCLEALLSFKTLNLLNCCQTSPMCTFTDISRFLLTVVLSICIAQRFFHSSEAYTVPRSPYGGIQKNWLCHTVTACSCIVRKLVQNFFHWSWLCQTQTSGPDRMVNFQTSCSTFTPKRLTVS